MVNFYRFSRILEGCIWFLLLSFTGCTVSTAHVGPRLSKGRGAPFLKLCEHAGSRSADRMSHMEACFDATLRDADI